MLTRVKPFTKIRVAVALNNVMNKYWVDVTEMIQSGQRRWVGHLQALMYLMESGTPQERAVIGYDRNALVAHVLDTLQYRISEGLRVSYYSPFLSRWRASSDWNTSHGRVLKNKSGLHRHVYMKLSHTWRRFSKPSTDSTLTKLIKHLRSALLWPFTKHSGRRKELSHYTNKP